MMNCKIIEKLVDAVLEKHSGSHEKFWNFIKEKKVTDVKLSSLCDEYEKQLELFDSQDSETESSILKDAFLALQDYCSLIGGKEYVEQVRQEDLNFLIDCRKIIDCKDENLDQLLGEIGCSN